MCGIAGWIDYNKPVGDQIKTADSMSDTLKRRGPDAHGEYFGEEVFLLHRRLVVVDPQNGLQPMAKGEEGSRFIITYNGELYNTEELRAELIGLGYSFCGHSDTEVLLTSYLAWGKGCLDKLNGIFAFGIWDEKEKQFFAARDRCGVKPFFYSLVSGGLIFGSEIKTLLAHPQVPARISREGLFQIFLLGPGRKLGSGVFENIKELLPGHFMTFSQDGLKEGPYWRLTSSEHTDGEKETIARTRFLVEDAISRQLVSDVPLCTLLSGGLDSSIISTVAANEYQKAGKQLTTYSVDYADNEKFFKRSLFQPSSDAPYIAMMEDAIKSRHRPVILSNEQLAAALGEAAWARDLPGMTDIDSSLLLFSREIKKDFTVGLSGECADELFGGYPWYHNPDILFEDTFPWSRSTAVRRSILKEGALEGGGDEYVRSCYLDTISKAEALPGEDAHALRMRQMFLLNFEWFMQTLLDRKDRMSMYCGLEMRVPFCDHRIVEYTYNMPWALKSLYGREKGILREAFSGCLPPEITWRKKSPYPKTHNPSYFAYVVAEAEAALSDKKCFLGEMIDKKSLEELKQNPDSIKEPWYGQLMRAPQIFAYLLQIYYWAKKYRVELV